MTLIFVRTNTSSKSTTNNDHNVILQDITLSFCCFHVLCGNTLCGFHYLIFIVWFLQFCFHYLVGPTLFPIFGFHTKHLAACRLFLRSKTGTRCLASLALPSCVTRATANVRFRKIRKHFGCLKKGGRCVSFWRTNRAHYQYTSNTITTTITITTITITTITSTTNTAIIIASIITVRLMFLL